LALVGFGMAATDDEIEAFRLQTLRDEVAVRQGDKSIQRSTLADRLKAEDYMRAQNRMKRQGSVFAVQYPTFTREPE
jgi:hypothetical protein